MIAAVAQCGCVASEIGDGAQKGHQELPARLVCTGCGVFLPHRPGPFRQKSRPMETATPAQGKSHFLFDSAASLPPLHAWAYCSSNMQQIALLSMACLQCTCDFRLAAAHVAYHPLILVGIFCLLQLKHWAVAGCR